MPHPRKHLAALPLCPMLASPWAFASDDLHIEPEVRETFSAGLSDDTSDG